MSEYKSPIKVTFEDISNEVINRYDDAIICIVKKITGIDVDKERLTNALLLDKKLVRCKDCKYCEDESYTDEDTGKEVKYLVCDRWYEQDDADGNMFPKADDFCSRGERKKPTEF